VKIHSRIPDMGLGGAKPLMYRKYYHYHWYYLKQSIWQPFYLKA